MLDYYKLSDHFVRILMLSDACSSRAHADRRVTACLLISKRTLRLWRYTNVKLSIKDDDAAEYV